MSPLSGKICLRCLGLLLAGLLTQARPAAGTELYGGAGTEGLTLGVGQGLRPNWGVRAEVSGWQFSRSLNADGNRYDADLKLGHLAILGDGLPMPSTLPLRLTTGLLIGNDRVTARGDGSRTINGIPVSVDAAAPIRATVRFPTVRPYIGLGLGHSPSSEHGLSGFADVGTAYGSPRTSLQVPNAITQTYAVQPSDIAAEQHSIDHKLKALRWYPVLKLGMAVHF